MRPRAKQIVENFATRFQGKWDDKRLPEHVTFLMEEAARKDPQVFTLMAEEAHKVPDLPLKLRAIFDRLSSQRIRRGVRRR